MVTLQILCGLLPNKAMVGDIKSNPWVFAPHDLISFQFTINGRPTPVFQSAMNFTTGDVLPAYLDLVDKLNLSTGPFVNTHLTLSEFKTFSCFFYLDVSRCLCNLYHKHPETSGTLDVSLTFRTPPTEALTLVSYMSYHKVSVHTAQHSTGCNNYFILFFLFPSFSLPLSTTTTTTTTQLRS